MKQIPLVRRTVTYHTEMVNLVDFLKQNDFELAMNREERTVDIRLPTQWESYTHYAGNIHWDDIEEADLRELKKLICDNRHLDFVAKYQTQVNWKNDYLGCKLNTTNLFDEPDD